MKAQPAAQFTWLVNSCEVRQSAVVRLIEPRQNVATAEFTQTRTDDTITVVAHNVAGKAETSTKVGIYT